MDFFYSGEMEISEDNVQELLPVACLLQVQSVQQACCEFLKRQLSSDNCLGKLVQCKPLISGHTKDKNILPKEGSKLQCGP